MIFENVWERWQYIVNYICVSDDSFPDK